MGAPRIPQPKSHLLYLVAVPYFMAFDTVFHPLSFRATNVTSGIPNQVVWATNSECTKPRARILATGALHLPNHVPTLDQLTVTSFHKRTP